MEHSINIENSIILSYLQVLFLKAGFSLERITARKRRSQRAILKGTRQSPDPGLLTLFTRHTIGLLSKHILIFQIVSHTILFKTLILDIP